MSVSVFGRFLTCPFPLFPTIQKYTGLLKERVKVAQGGVNIEKGRVNIQKGQVKTPKDGE